MAILVDPAVWVFKGKHYCHMMSDTSLDELHEFAQKLGVKRSWFQSRGGRYPHYDVSAAMRTKAVEMGAVEVTAPELLRRCKGAR